MVMGRYLELLKYGGGGWRSFITILEGNKGRGWVECATQMRKVQNFHERSGRPVRNDATVNGGVNLAMPRLVEEEKRHLLRS
jgi:hypothetical protein